MCILRSRVVATWKKELELEGAILVRRLAWAVYQYIKVSQIVVVRNRADARNSILALGHNKAECTSEGSSRLCHKTLSLLDDSFGEGHGEWLWDRRDGETERRSV